MTQDFWSDKRPQSWPDQIDPDQYESLMQIFEESVQRFAGQPAFSCGGATISYHELDQYSSDFASYIQHETNLREGDRIALQMPNLIQYPVCVFGALKAGLVVVNTNPLYTEKELAHQFNDAQVRALVVLENICETVADVLPKTQIETVIITRLYDMDKLLKRMFVASALKYVRRGVPDYDIPLAIPFSKVLSVGRKQAPVLARVRREDLAVLQYTGGTTGIAKGAMLTHRNLVSNLLQLHAVLQDFLEPGSETLVAPLPLYHIYSFTLCCMCMLHNGAHVVLVTNPRDVDAFVEDLGELPMTLFVGLNTLFRALSEHPKFMQLDFSRMKLTVSGGMALQRDVAERWEQLTGCAISEGYGLTETSPVVSVNPAEAIIAGSVGLPLPSTELRLVDDSGVDVSIGTGESGELWVRGPQVMAGYWQQEEDTRAVLTEDGWLRTGDIASIPADGYLRIVDRAKDLIIVSGFNVYPNEIEDVVAMHPDVLECVAIGVPDDRTGEAVKVFLVARAAEIDLGTLEDLCRQHLTGYKVPRSFELRDALPMSDVGKVLRRRLREELLEE